jgi:mono/diheme cytochrome c family protein
MGSAYVVIYIVLMWEMVPRMWEYQFELPARTVIHACMGILIGVLLIAKISIIRWFQHFGKALPALGLWLLACTILLATLSVPFALRAHDFGDAMSPENLERVERLLTNIEWDDPEVDAAALVTEDAFERGREVLTGKCVVCHDMRTILYKPRTADKWYSVVKRMATKPMVGERLFDHELPVVTAYLVAITPDIQRSRQMGNAEARAQVDRVAQVRQAPTTVVTEEAPVIDEAAAEQLLEERCMDCHELDVMDEHGADTAEGWSEVIAQMVEEGAELSEEEASLLIAYLVAKYDAPAGESEAAPAPGDESSPAVEPEEEPAAEESGDVEAAEGEGASDEVSAPDEAPSSDEGTEAEAVAPSQDSETGTDEGAVDSESTIAAPPEGAESEEAP